MHNWNPADYERSSSAQCSWAIGLISGLDIEGDESIMDIGCGDGKISATLASLVPRGRVIGIDLSSEMINFARSRYPKEDFPNLSFQVGNASALNFPEEFDLAVSFACLHWVKDHLPVLKGVHRSLRPGGKVLFQCGGRGNAGKILDITEELTRSERWAQYYQGFRFPYHFYGAEEYKLWLSLAGLKARRVELVPKDMVHQGQAGLEGIIRNTWLPYMERLPAGLRPDFVSDVARRYIERYPLDEDGKVHVAMMRLEVEADKPS